LFLFPLRLFFLHTDGFVKRKTFTMGVIPAKAAIQ